MVIISTLIFAVCSVAAVPNGQPVRTSTDAIGVLGRAKSGDGYSIIGSQFTSITKYPYNAAVLSVDNVLLGGGFIYRKRWIVTAAFTTQEIDKLEDLRVRLGSHSPFEGGQHFSLSKVIIHPNYNGSWDWDLALLKLEKNAKFGKKAKPIKITRIAPKTGSTGVVTGWGYTSVSATSKLQYLEVDIYDRETCDEKWYTSYHLNERSYCAYKSQAGPCEVDFGDPLVSNGKAVGLYLGGYGCAKDNYPGIYCDLSKFYHWINETIKKNKHDDGGTVDDNDTADDDENVDVEVEDEELE